MELKLTEQDVQSIIQGVLKNIGQTLGEAKGQGQGAAAVSSGYSSVPALSVSHQNTVAPHSSQRGEYGVFERVDDAIGAATAAYAKFAKEGKLSTREKLVQAIRETTLKHKEQLAKLIWDETGLGRIEHKIAKLELTANKTPGTEDLNTQAYSGDEGLTIVEESPFGVVGAVTPVTNPAETVINNSIGLIAAGNAVVFNVHPSSKKSCAYTVQLLNKAIVAAGGPMNLITMVKDPSKESLDAIIEAPEVKLLLGTGGPGLVKTLLSSGKKAIGAGAGNPPVVVDETADMEHAAKEIIAGASFENNILCIAEKEVFVVNSAADDLIFHMLNHGAYRLNQRELDQVMSFALEVNAKQVASGCSLDPKRDYHVAKDWLGKDASLFLEKIGVRGKDDVKLLICEVDFSHPFVQLEQMMPILPIVRVHDLDEAIELAVKAEHGNRHTAIMHSTNVYNLTKFARAIGTTIFVKNASSLAGVGYGGEGYATMTIAGPTGEGLTSARAFTRKVRCVMADGGFRIIG